MCSTLVLSGWTSHVVSVSLLHASLTYDCARYKGIVMAICTSGPGQPDGEQQGHCSPRAVHNTASPEYDRAPSCEPQQRVNDHIIHHTRQLAEHKNRIDNLQGVLDATRSELTAVTKVVAALSEQLAHDGCDREPANVYQRQNRGEQSEEGNDLDKLKQQVAKLSQHVRQLAKADCELPPILDTRTRSKPESANGETQVVQQSSLSRSLSTNTVRPESAVELMTRQDSTKTRSISQDTVPSDAARVLPGLRAIDAASGIGSWSSGTRLACPERPGVVTSFTSHNIAPRSLPPQAVQRAGDDKMACAADTYEPSPRHHRRNRSSSREGHGQDRSYASSYVHGTKRSHASMSVDPPLQPYHSGAGHARSRANLLPGTTIDLHRDQVTGRIVGLERPKSHEERYTVHASSRHVAPYEAHRTLRAALPHDSYTMSREVLSEDAPSRKRSRTKLKRNGQGILIRKDGRPDMRSISSALNLKKVHAKKDTENGNDEDGRRAIEAQSLSTQAGDEQDAEESAGNVQEQYDSPVAHHSHERSDSGNGL